MPRITHSMVNLPAGASLKDEGPLGTAATALTDEEQEMLDAVQPSGFTDEDRKIVGAVKAPRPDSDGIVELEDGSAIVMDDEDELKEPDAFDSNLAVDAVPEFELVSIGMEFCELIEADKDARKERDKQYAAGIKKTGMSGTPKAGADFDGASSVVHPMLAKGCVDFASKAIKELFPSAGPVRTQIIGRQTDSKIDRAERKKTYMNWQLTEQIPEHRPEFEKMLSQLPLGGSQYKRWWYDAKMGRPRTMAVYIDDVFLPFDQNDFYTTPRLTHREFIGKTLFAERTSGGLYREVSGSKQGEQPERSEAAKAARDIEGVADDSAAYDQTGGTRQVYTVYADMELGDDPETDGELAPYILHIEEYGSKVLGIYRNWKEGDKRRQKLHWMVEYNFIPWRGAYAIGLAHLIGSMSTAATGAINALLDSAHINNFPGGVKLKGGRTAGQNVSVNATEIQEIDAPPGVDDIRKLVMAFPFNGPSAVLYNLMEWLTQQAEMVVSTASEKIADAGANMPMGTALALIESGSTNFSAIHARLHHSARRELEILHRLDATYLEDEETVEELGELVVYREDFVGPMDILPVSDPNIFSEAQRYAQLQAVMQLEAMPEFKPYFKPERLLVRALRLLQVPYAEDIANLPKDPMRLGPIKENAAVTLDDGTPLKVYEEQDDLMHMQSHITFMTSPMLGANPLIGASALPKLLAHCKEHMVAYYTKNHEAATKAFKTIALQQGRNITDEQAAASGHAFADKAMAEALAPMIAPGLQAAMKAAQGMTPKPPADGNTQASLAAQQNIEQMRLQQATKDKADQRTHELALKKMQLDFDAKQRHEDRNQQDQAAQVTASIEKMQSENEKTLGMITLQMEQEQEAVRENNKIMLQEMKSQAEAAMLVLQDLLSKAAAVEESPMDPQALIAPLLAGMQENSQYLASQLAEQSTATGSIIERMAQLDQSLQALHSASKAPRTHKFVKDERGNNVGVRTIFDEEQQ